MPTSVNNIYLQVSNSLIIARCPVDTGRKSNIHKTFNLRPVLTGCPRTMRQIYSLFFKFYFVSLD